MELAEKQFYDALPDDLYKYEKLVISETFANGYHFASTLDHKQYLYVFSYEFEKVDYETLNFQT